VLGEAECARVRAGGLDATDAWVMKEAVVKAAGRGVGAMRSVELGADRARLDGEDYWLGRLGLPATHAAWIARDRPGAVPAPEAVPAESFAPLPAER